MLKALNVIEKKFSSTITYLTELLNFNFNEMSENAIYHYKYF